MIDNKSIYIIFNDHEMTKRGNDGNRNEMLDALVDPYSKVFTLGEVVSKTVSLDGAIALLDCTENYSFYNDALNKKAGFEFKLNSGDSVIKTQRGNFIMKGVRFSELLSTFNSKNGIGSRLSNNDNEYEKEIEVLNIINKLSEDKVAEHHRLLDELGNQVPHIFNKKKYEKSMAGKGIEILADSFRSVRYQLVPDEETIVDAGVEKITPSDVKVLKDLTLILRYLK
jgi:hypothetical protein